MSKSESETTKFDLTVVDFKDMRNMMSGHKLYGIPTYISFDEQDRCYVWPLPYRVLVE